MFELKKLVLVALEASASDLPMNLITESLFWKALSKDLFTDRYLAVILEEWSGGVLGKMVVVLHEKNQKNQFV